MIWTFLAVATIALSGLRAAAGQGLDLDLSDFLGANSRLASQKSAWAQDTASAAGLLQKWVSERRSSKPCTGRGATANLCGIASVTKADKATLVVASSPAIYDTRVLAQTGGLYIAPEPRNQGDCNACVAYATAAAAQSAAASALQLNSSKVPFPSPRQLFYCGGDSPDCTTGWKLQQAVQVLANSGSWAADGLYSDECLSMDSIPQLSMELTTEDYCTPSCATTVPPGKFTYAKAWPLREVWEIQHHIRKHGASVVTRMTLPPGFIEYFSSRRKAVYDNPQAAKDAGKMGSAENHAVVLAGYNNVEEYWIIWSSWGKDWADGGFGRVRYNQLGIADPSFTYGVMFLPKQPPPPTYMLTPDTMLPAGCDWYQAQQGDYLFKVALKLGIPIQLLLNWNVGQIQNLGDWLPPGKKLRVCAVRSQPQSVAHAPAQTSKPATKPAGVAATSCPDKEGYTTMSNINWVGAKGAQANTSAVAESICNNIPKCVAFNSYAYYALSDPGGYYPCIGYQYGPYDPAGPGMCTYVKKGKTTSSSKCKTYPGYTTLSNTNWQANDESPHMMNAEDAKTICDADNDCLVFNNYAYYAVAAGWDAPWRDRYIPKEGMCTYIKSNKL